MIRLILVSIFLILFLVLTIPAMLVTWIIGKINKPAGDKASLWIVNKIGFRSVQFLAGVKTKVIGHDRIPDEPVLYICNHRGFFDTITSYQLVKNPTGYVAKKEILYAPLLNIWMLLLNCQFLDRKKPRSGMDMLLKSIELIKKGISVCIFPEGTRNKNTEETILEFHKGSFKIAEMAGCRIVPVVLNNTSPIFEDHLPAIKSQHVIIEYMKPIDMTGMGRAEKRELPDKIREQMIQVYNKNQAMI